MRRSLTKQERLRTRAEIDRVFASGQTTGGKGMRLAYASNGLARVRVAVIPARGHRNAVSRNRTKRLAREAFRLNKHQIVNGVDLVIVCYPGDFQFADRQEQFLRLISRANLFRPDSPGNNHV